MAQGKEKRVLTTDEIIKGTFLEEIIAIAKRGGLESVRDTPIKKGERLLTKATLLEKACRIFMEECKRMSRQMIDAGQSPESDDVQNWRYRKDISRQLFWDLLFDRLPEAYKLRLRQEWQIVESSSKDS